MKTTKTKLKIMLARGTNILRFMNYRIGYNNATFCLAVSNSATISFTISATGFIS
ncbi:hypothetical protein SAMN05444148_1855 [Winogradskyella jejuensis]|uniref:Uncharacterized protein n=1 Tax=Winogradskyella jejuensis TaxID=1089305 RepID=A0A1M5SFK5_9FLAO|nr:hypothetical protein SAMN05444148_1855 [Winogradskyella jejuensis]